MAQHSFKYPFGAWWGKLILWLFLTLFIVSLLFDFLGALLAFIQGNPGQSDWTRLALSILVGLLIISYALNLYPNVETSSGGMLIDHFWWRRLVSWKDLVALTETGNMAFKVWAIEARGLPLLYRMYGLVYLRSPRRPCFLIFGNLPEHQMLLKEIKRHLPG